MDEWISVRDKLPEKNGEYIAAVKALGKHGSKDYYVQHLYFAESLSKINATFSDFDSKKYDEYVKNHDHSRFYYTFGYGEAEEIEIDSDTAIDDIRVYYWMPMPLPPLDIPDNTLIGYSTIPQ